MGPRVTPAPDQRRKELGVNSIENGINRKGLGAFLIGESLLI
jgi:hypothetical protein